MLKTGHWILVKSGLRFFQKSSQVGWLMTFQGRSQSPWFGSSARDGPPGSWPRISAMYQAAGKPIAMMPPW